MIKGVKPSGNYKSGEYIPINKDKYKGEYPIVCRSSWESKFCLYLDLTPQILKWASEPFEIPYYNAVDKKIHRYYPDFYFEVLQINNELVKYVAEIKPDGFLTKPSKPTTASYKKRVSYNYQLRNYLQIISKKDAAVKWSTEKGYKYVFITENSWKKLFK